MSERIKTQLIIVNEGADHVLCNSLREVPILITPRYPYSDCQYLSTVSRRQLGLSLRPMRTLKGYSHQRIVYCELDPSIEIPGELNWYPIKSIADSASEGLNKSLNSSTPWSMPGWFKKANGWVNEELKKHHIEKTAAMTPHKVWALSYVARMSVGQKMYWFKASPGFFSTETPLTDWLSNQFPEISPSVLATDKENNWVLMEDFGPTNFSVISNGNILAKYLQLLGDMQVSCAQKTSELRYIGLKERTLTELLEFIDWLDSEPAEVGSMGIDHLRSMKQSLPDLRNSSERLLRHSVPLSIEHGDLDASNAFIPLRSRNNTPTYMDWSDAVIGHPFFTMSSFWGLSIKHGIITNSYLKSFGEFNSEDGLIAEYKETTTLSALWRTFLYWKLKEEVPKDLWWEIDPFYYKMMRLISTQKALYLSMNN